MQDGPPLNAAGSGVSRSQTSVVHCVHTGRAHAVGYLLAVTLITFTGAARLAVGDDSTDLANAAEVGDLTRVRMLLDAIPSLVSGKVIAPATAREQFPGLRIDAASIGTIGVALALEKGHSPANGYGGLTPLHIATLKHHKEIVELLLTRSADANAADDDGWTPLIYAASFSCPKEIAELLIAHGAHAETMDRNGLTALHWAARHGNTEVAAVLLSHHAEINTRANDLMTALSWAVLEPKNGPMVTLLLSGGADVTMVDRDGYTALHHAASADKEIVAALLDHHADPNSKAKDGSRPLHKAAQWGNAEAVQLLLAHGADVNAKAHGWTPVRVAEQWHHDYVADLLRDHGGRR
jgi:ankyrin repeat protein